MNCFPGYFALLLLWGSSGLGHGEDCRAPGTEPNAIIRNAIDARGGRRNLNRYRGYRWRAKSAVSNGTEMGLAKMEYVYRNKPMSCRMVAEIEFPSETRNQRIVYDGTMVWQNLNGITQAGNAENIQDARAAAYDYGAVYLFDLLNTKRFSLSKAPAKKINGTESLGVRVSCKRYHDILLYFDKNTWHLVKMESLWGEKYPHRESQEVYYEDYKKIKGGVMHFTKMTFLKDGKRNLEWELMDIEPLTEVKDSEFAKP